MTIHRVVLTSRGEASIAQIREALALFRWLEANKRVGQRLGPSSLLLPPAHLVLPRIVSVAEDFARALLLDASEPLLDTSHPLRLAIWIQAEEQAESSWQKLRGAWKEWHAVDLSDAPCHLAFSGFVEARNSIMHGLGELTRKQSRTTDALKKTASRLGHAHLSLNGRRLVLTHTSIEEAVDASVALVEWLDRQAVTRHLVALA